MEFIPVEIAKNLRAKGFKEKCHNHYDFDKDSSFTTSIPECWNSCNDYVDLPTISQVLEWLRKVHHLHFEVVAAAYGYNLIISDTPDKGGTDRYYSHVNDDGPNDGGAWDDHDDCVLHGINYTITKLI